MTAPEDPRCSPIISLAYELVLGEVCFLSKLPIPTGKAVFLGVNALAASGYSHGNVKPPQARVFLTALLSLVDEAEAHRHVAESRDTQQPCINARTIVVSVLVAALRLVHRQKDATPMAPRNHGVEQLRGLFGRQSFEVKQAVILAGSQLADLRQDHFNLGVSAAFCILAQKPSTACRFHDRCQDGVIIIVSELRQSHL